MGPVEELVAAVTKYGEELYSDVSNASHMIDLWGEVEVALRKVAGKPEWPEWPGDRQAAKPPAEVALALTSTVSQVDGAALDGRTR